MIWHDSCINFHLLAVNFFHTQGGGYRIATYLKYNKKKRKKEPKVCYKTFLSLSPHAHFAGPRKFLMPFSGGGTTHKLHNDRAYFVYDVMFTCRRWQHCQLPALSPSCSNCQNGQDWLIYNHDYCYYCWCMCVLVVVPKTSPDPMTWQSPPKAVKLRKTFTSLRLVGETWNCHAPPASSSSSFGDSERGDAAVPWMDRKMLVLETKEVNLIKLLRLFSPFARNLAPEHNSLIAVNPVPKIYNQSEWGQFGLEIKPEIDTLG